MPECLFARRREPRKRREDGRKAVTDVAVELIETIAFDAQEVLVDGIDEDAEGQVAFEFRR